MKVSIKKVEVDHFEEWKILVNKKAIAIAFTHSDAKFVAKCIKKYKKKEKVE